MWSIIHAMAHLMKKIENLYKKALELESLSVEEGSFLYKEAPLDELMYIGAALRQIHMPGKKVGWIIDRNVNITNICFSRCLFCNFCRRPGSNDGYVTTIDQYIKKIDELMALGGDQLLLQGGMNPKLGIDFYTSLFKELKKLYPELKLHALGPPEIVFIAKKEGMSIKNTLSVLIEAGLDSLPGAGAEILSDRVRKILSPVKASVKEWSDVMIEAHQLNLPTSATMMYGHIETVEERVEHLAILREIQNNRPKNSYGFISFIPWPFSDEGTLLKKQMEISSNYNSLDYLRLIAISRLMLNNITNIQTSVLTVGKDTGIISLNAGANDVGSVMIEENVVSAAGSNNMFNAEELISIIKEAGYEPIRRNQKYEALS